MSLVPYITDSPVPEMDCGASMIALGIAFAIATNLLHHTDRTDKDEGSQTLQPTTMDVGVQTDPESPQPLPSPLPSPRANTSWSVTAPKSYVPRSQISNKNMDKDIIAILTSSNRPLTYKDILLALKRSTTRGLLYETMTKHDMNVHLYMMLNDKVVKQISEPYSDCPYWTLP